MPLNSNAFANTSEQLSVQDQPLAYWAGNACDILKLATDDVHNRLHRDPNLSKLVSPSVTLHDVAHCLTRFEDFYNIYKNRQLSITNEVCQRTLTRWMSPHLRWLQQDLARLSNISEDRQIKALRREKLQNERALSLNASFDFDDFATLWGYLYVTEGSLMGGSVIARCLAKHLAVDTALPQGLNAATTGERRCNLSFDYFKAYGNPQTQDHWRRVKTAINDAMADASDEEMERLVAAARKGFLTMELVFDCRA